MSERASRRPSIGQVLLAALFIGSGVMHFIKPDFFVGIVPPIFPAPQTLVAVSGFFEILGGVGVLLPFARRAAGYGLIALLIAVYPANIYMLLKYQQEHDVTLFTFLLILRLPLQFALIWWAYRAALASKEIP